MARKADVVIENADVRWRNFSEAVNPYSKYDKDRGDGKSVNGGSFVIFLHNGLEEQLEHDFSAPIEWTKENPNRPNPNFVSEPFIRVGIQFDKANTWKNPTIWMITGDNHVQLNEDTMANLDSAEVGNWDVSLNFAKAGKHKAYLNTLYATVIENQLDSKYGF